MRIHSLSKSKITIVSLSLYHNFFTKYFANVNGFYCLSYSNSCFWLVIIVLVVCLCLLFEKLKFIWYFKMSSWCTIFKLGVVCVWVCVCVSLCMFFFHIQSRNIFVHLSAFLSFLLCQCIILFVCSCVRLFNKCITQTTTLPQLWRPFSSASKLLL